MLEGASNFRDLGGHPTVDGGSTRRGRVFRSDAPHRLTAADLAAVRDLGLRVAYDLRSDEERDRAPSMLPAEIRCEVLPIGGAAGRTDGLGGLFMAGRLAEVPPDFLVQMYEAMAETAATTLGRLLTGLAEPGGLPALIHCTAGKDRTGIDVERYHAVFGAPRSAMAALLATVRAKYGTIEGYSCERAGVGPEVLTALRGLMTD